jgi:hypothetical protein
MAPAARRNDSSKAQRQQAQQTLRYELAAADYERHRQA